jgi:hypothetical protein
MIDDDPNNKSFLADNNRKRERRGPTGVDSASQQKVSVRREDCLLSTPARMRNNKQLSLNLLEYFFDYHDDDY